MNIAELFVRIRGDTTDVTRKLKGVETSLVAVGRSGTVGQLGIGKIQNALSALVVQSTGTNRAVGTLATTMGAFAFGSPVVAAALIGLAAVAKAQELMGRTAKAAAEEQKKLADALLQQFRPKTGPESLTAQGFTAALKERAELTRKLVTLESQGAGTKRGDPFGILGREREAALTRIQELTKGINNTMMGSISALETVTVKGRDMAKVALAAQQKFEEATKAALGIFTTLETHGISSGPVNEALISAYQRIAAQIRAIGDAATPTRARLMDLREALMANAAVGVFVGATNATGTVGPLAGKTLPGVTLTSSGTLPNVPMPKVGSPSDPLFKVGDELQIQLQKDADRAAQNAQMLQSAIAQSASIIGSTIVSALNVGGGGKGSNLGGALGGTAGSVAGMILGAGGGPVGLAIGSAIGSTVGSILGSALGGLFDSNTKAVNANTLATQANTMALLLNPPSGYKVAASRYDATDIKELGREVMRHATRGGAPPLMAGR